jgi:hypothetical protein
MKMKNYIIALISMILIGAGFTSCNEKIKLSGEFEETAVVYGLLDQADSVHYIKITRAFIGNGNSNSFDIAQIPDSNYFDHTYMEVTIEELKSNGATGRTWVLDTVTVPNKDQNGVFYAPDQRLYYFNTGANDNATINASQEPLLEGATYKLKIVVNKGLAKEFEVTAQTGIVTGIGTTTDAPTFRFQFAKNSQVTGLYNNPAIGVVTGNSSVINTSLTVTYKEYHGADSSYKSFDWNLGEYEVDQAGSSMSVGTNGQSFFELVAASCSTSDPSVFKRNLEGITVKVVGGGEEFYNYMLVNQPSSSLAQSKPTYTNLTATGEHPVVGIFSSRFTHEVYHPYVDPAAQNYRCIDQNSAFELCAGPITGIYLFCSNHAFDISQNKPWACN